MNDDVTSADYATHEATNQRLVAAVEALTVDNAEATLGLFQPVFDNGTDREKTLVLVVFEELLRRIGNLAKDMAREQAEPFRRLAFPAARSASNFLRTALSPANFAEPVFDVNRTLVTFETGALDIERYHKESAHDGWDLSLIHGFRKDSSNLAHITLADGVAYEGAYDWRNLTTTLNRVA